MFSYFKSSSSINNKMATKLLTEYEDCLADAEWKDSANDHIFIQTCLEAERESVAGFSGASGFAPAPALEKSQSGGESGTLADKDTIPVGSDPLASEESKNVLEIKKKQADVTGGTGSVSTFAADFGESGALAEEDNIPIGSDPLGSENNTNVLFSPSPWDDDYIHLSSPNFNDDNLSPPLQYPDDDLGVQFSDRADTSLSCRSGANDD